ncbi:hypothetical protein DDW01_00810 [Sulfolobus sp. SCGC AB-777_G05]|nr:hypothetical protein DDW01_00810 [Sulfolobus sp. SCGC AB-777_G05]
MTKIIEKILREEEAIVEIKDGEVSVNDLYYEIPIGVRILIRGSKRRRLVDLGILSFIVRNCNGTEFAKDYLNLSHSLKYIFEKYGVYTELEFLALCDEEKLKCLDKDLLAILQKLKIYIVTRNNETS